MVKILFWNVARKDLSSLVCTIAADISPNVVVLNENAANEQDTLRSLQVVSPTFHIPNTISTGRFHCFSNDQALDLNEVHSGFWDQHSKAAIIFLISQSRSLGASRATDMTGTFPD